MKDVDWEKLEIVPRLPSVFESQPGEAVPPSLVGATIVAFGTLPGIDIEGGGLVIDYVDREERAHRVVFAFNELGMWTKAVLGGVVTPADLRSEDDATHDAD